ncbi:MAG: hypothetical protein NTV33_00085 [Coprothermobacterota bacterium]|nr:hypothetical protein [Coprothermobacterota bacterium]
MAKLIFALFLVVYGIFLAASPETYRFLDRVDLVFHEAGHWIFRAFGPTLTVLGGTLMQLLIPTLLAGYFLLRRSFYSASVMLFWLGQSFFNVSVYARDARAMALPLLGGGGHDWNWLLSQAGLLAQDQAVANAFFGVGLAFLILSMAGSLYFSFFDRLPWKRLPPLPPPDGLQVLFPDPPL